MVLQVRTPIGCSGGDEAGDVPGVVALAATAQGVIYEGAFGRRRLPDSASMMPRLDLLDRLDGQSGRRRGGDAAGRAGHAVARAERGGDLPATRFACRCWTGSTTQGTPRLRAARRPITLRHLLTHTAGYGYDNWNADMLRYVRQTGLLGASSGKLAALDAPLLFDPGERWEYGISIDWLGRIVDAVSGKTLDAYMREHIFDPLGMHDTAYLLSAGQRARLAQLHRRAADGTLAPTEERQPLQRQPQFFPGGGGLHSTGRDYLTFLRMLLNGGRLNGARNPSAGNRRAHGTEPHRSARRRYPESANAAHDS